MSDLSILEIQYADESIDVDEHAERIYAILNECG